MRKERRSIEMIHFVKKLENHRSLAARNMYICIDVVDGIVATIRKRLQIHH